MAAPAEQLQSVTVFQRVARSCFMKTPVCILDFFWPANPDAASYSGLCVCVWFTCLVQRNFHISSPCLSHLTRLSWRPPLPRPPHLWGRDRTNAGRRSLRERAWCRWCPTSTCLPSVCVNTPHVIWVSSAWSSPNGLNHLHSVLNLLGVTASSSYLFRK